MAELLDEFNKCAERVRKEMSEASNLNKFSTSEKMTAYGLFKQASVGDVQGDQPWSFQMEARAKWDGWAKYKGMDKEDAMREYIKFATEKLSG